jgi:hypothetical protein
MLFPTRCQRNGQCARFNWRGRGGIDQLKTIAADSNGPAEMLRVYGGGGWRFYTSAGSVSYTSPAENTGGLAQSGSNYTYTTPDGTVSTFNSSG